MRTQATEITPAITLRYPRCKFDMDPLTITAAAGSLVATIFTLVKSVGSFVATARNSRTELDAVSQELISLQVCLEVLESDRRHGTLFGNELEVSIHKVLVNIELCCGQIESMLAKLKASRFGRPVKWATLQKDQMNQLRSSLETYKTALQMALQLNTISIVVKETQRLTASQSSLAQQVDEAYATMQQINQKVDGIARAQERSPALQRIHEAMANLSSSIKDVASRNDNLSLLIQQSCKFARESLTPIQHIDGVPEIESKLGLIQENPFMDPFSETDHVSEREILEKGAPDGTSPCWFCSSKLDGADQSVVQTKLQQLKTDWRCEWTTQLKQELIVFGRQNGKTSSETLERYTMTSADRRTASDSIVDDITDLLSEVMTITSWNDTDGDNAVSDIRSTSTGAIGRQSDITNRMGRLQTKYDSARKRIQSLIEEVTDLKNENLELRDDVDRLQGRFARARAAPSLQMEALQRECEDLRYIADQATGNLTELQASHKQLQASYDHLQVPHGKSQYSYERLSASYKELQASYAQLQTSCQTSNVSLKQLRASYQQLQHTYDSEREKMRVDLQELTELRSSLQSMSEEVESLKNTAASTSEETARLKLDELPAGFCQKVLTLQVPSPQPLHPGGTSYRWGLNIKYCNRDVIRDLLETSVGVSVGILHGLPTALSIIIDQYPVTIWWCLQQYFIKAASLKPSIVPLNCNPALGGLFVNKGWTAFTSGSFVKKNTGVVGNLIGTPIDIYWIDPRHKELFRYIED